MWIMVVVWQCSADEWSSSNNNEASKTLFFACSLFWAKIAWIIIITNGVYLPQNRLVKMRRRLKLLLTLAHCPIAVTLNDRFELIDSDARRLPSTQRWRRNNKKKTSDPMIRKEIGWITSAIYRETKFIVIMRESSHCLKFIVDDGRECECGFCTKSVFFFCWLLF